ncbi:protein AIR1 [Mercurialis annua]|uniref:protein AIR1 n=1 Tax=Mercurialis annua TaxID=3986 RepID=UPI00215E8B57|nr:protein AIR1 [Mercurialis annua]
MAKGDKQKAKIEEEEEENPVIELSSGDEANEDLSLQIVKKALQTRAAKLAQNGSNIVVLDDDDDNNIDASKNDTGVIGVTGRDELASSSSPPVDADVSVKKRKKKKKKIQKKEEIQIQSAKEEGNAAETIQKVAVEEALENVEAVEMAAELYPNAETSAIEVPENMVLRKLLRGPRYFDPPDNNWSKCFNCGEEGHMAVNCPSFEKKRRPCFLCGGLDHGVRQCSKERVCIICKSVGHRPNKCPEKHKGGLQNAKVCLKCGDSGHDMFSCKNNYSHDDLKEIQCYICKNFGHLCCVNSLDNRPSEVSCYKCGELGHTGLECLSLYDKAATTASSSSCFKCGEGGHFARECTSSVKAGKRNHEISTPTLRRHRENNEALGFKSAPQDLNKSRKKRKSKFEEGSNTTPTKSKQRGGWLAEDPEEYSQSKSKKNHWRSPSTPSYKGYKNSFVGQTSSSSMHKSYSGMSRSPYYKKPQNNHSESSALHSSASSFHNRYYSASRFSNSGSAGFRDNYTWW